jgi:hypothetical protein
MYTANVSDKHRASSQGQHEMLKSCVPDSYLRPTLLGIVCEVGYNK